MNVNGMTKMLNETTGMNWGEAQFYDGDLFWTSGKDRAEYHWKRPSSWLLTIKGVSGSGSDPEWAMLEIQKKLNPDPEPLNTLERIWPLGWERCPQGFVHASEHEDSSDGGCVVTVSQCSQNYDTGETLWALRVEVFGVSMERGLEELRALCSKT